MLEDDPEVCRASQAKSKLVLLQHCGEFKQTSLLLFQQAKLRKNKRECKTQVFAPKIKDGSCNPKNPFNRRHERSTPGMLRTPD